MAGQHIFISYARKDGADFAEKLDNALINNGFSPFWDKDYSESDDSWQKNIETTIRESRALLLLITPYSLRSPHCRAEWLIAFNADIPVIPLLVKDTDEPVPFQLQALNALDFTSRADMTESQLIFRLHKLETPEGQTEEAQFRRNARRADWGTRGRLEARRLTDANHVIGTPDKLFGRADALAHIHGQLRARPAGRVLLHGPGGEGKTAVAARIAHEWLKERQSAVLWLTAGNAESDVLFEAVARSVSTEAALTMAAQNDDGKKMLCRQLLIESQTGLWVIDDACNGPALYTLLEGAPRDLPILVTARQRFVLHDMLETRPLPEDDAAGLIRHYAGHYAADEGRVRELSHKLGYLPFAVELAGRNLHIRKHTAEYLLKQLEKGRQTAAQMGLYGWDGPVRANVAALLKTSIDALPEETQMVFSALGDFFVPSVTPLMLALYLRDVPEITHEQLVNIRKTNPRFAAMSDEHLRQMVMVSLLRDINTTPVANALDKLAEHGLVQRINPTEDANGYYRIHDLSYHYLSAQVTPQTQSRAAITCLNYVLLHQQPSLMNFSALRPELDNIMGAAEWGRQNGWYKELQTLVEILVAPDDGFLASQSFISAAVQLLEWVASAAHYHHDEVVHTAVSVYIESVIRRLEDIPQVEFGVEEGAIIEDEPSPTAEVAPAPDETSEDVETPAPEHDKLNAAAQALEERLAKARATNSMAEMADSLQALAKVYLGLGKIEKVIDCLRALRDIFEAVGRKDLIAQVDANIAQLSTMVVPIPAPEPDEEPLIETSATIEALEQRLNEQFDSGDTVGVIGTLQDLISAYYGMGQIDKAIAGLNQLRELVLVLDRQDLAADFDAMIEHLSAQLPPSEQPTAFPQPIGEPRDLREMPSIDAEAGEPIHIRSLKESLKHDRELEDRVAETQDLMTLANAYIELSDFESAIDYGEQALDKVRGEHNDRTEWRILGILGRAYAGTARAEESLECHERALKLARERGDKRGMADALTDWAQSNALLGQPQQALDHYQEAYNLFEKQGVVYMLEQIREQMAALQPAHENGASATPELPAPVVATIEENADLRLFKNQLELARAAQDLLYEASCLVEIATIYDRDLGEVQTAIPYYEQALTIYATRDDKLDMFKFVDKRLEKARNKIQS